MLNTIAKAVNYLFGKSLQNQDIILTNSLSYLKRERQLDKNYFDKVRLSALELASYEIEQKGLAGNVAEVGVYRGKFTRYINQFFPQRMLYLFDTFEGFDQKDVAKEKQQHFSTGEQDFSNTSVKAVLNIMPHPGKCIVKKGFFPHSAEGVNDTFVFVSLDADLYEPIYNGLQFFYPKLVSGGYIFIHDFNNEGYKGARKAVEQFCSQQGIGYTPIPDSGGSAIIAK